MGKMNIHRKEIPVGKSQIALPDAHEMRPFTAHIDKKLYAAVQEIAKAQRRSVREIVEWGMKQFLFASNPNLAAKLGIHAAAE
jgi:hypothetical protein